MPLHRIITFSGMAWLICALCLHPTNSLGGDRGFTNTAPDSELAAQVGQGDLYALVVGVSKYKHSKIPNLNVSDKDAKDFAGFIRGQKKLFMNVYVRVLTNEQATRSEIEKELYYNLRKAGKNDTVVVFLSGHGVDDPNTPGEYFFLSYDADPDYLAASAVQMSRQSFINKLDSKRVVLIADTCQSGGFAGAGTKRLKPSLDKMMGQFKESEGKVLITSSRADEYSKESPEHGNSLFTYYLLEGLKGNADEDGDGIVSLKELYEYIYAKTKDASDGYQHPQIQGRIVGSFPVALTNRSNMRERPPQAERVDQKPNDTPSVQSGRNGAGPRENIGNTTPSASGGQEGGPYPDLGINGSYWLSPYEPGSHKNPGGTSG